MSDALAKVPLPTCRYSYLILIFAGLARGSLWPLRREPLLGQPISPGSPLWHRRIDSRRYRPSRPILAASEGRPEVFGARVYSACKVGILCLYSIISLASLSPSHTHHTCPFSISHNGFMLGTWIVFWPTS